MGKPGNSYNDLELVEGDIADDDSNEKYNGPLDPRAGNVNVEIPRIRFNPKDVAKLLNKYVTEVDCTRKCLMEISKLLKWYNRLGDGILPYKPKDLKLKSQVLKRKKKKHLSKMVKEGVKKLEMIDSKIKKSSREVIDNHKSMKELNKLGELIVEHGKIGKSVWKVRKFEESDALKENFSLNGSWTVSEETKNNEENKSLDVNNDEVPLLVPIGFNVEETNDKTPTKIQNDTSTPSLKALTTDSSKKDSNSNKRKNTKSKFADGPNNNNSLNIKLNNSLNTSLNNSWSVSINNDGSASKKTQNMNKSAVEEKHTTISLDEPDTTITNISSNVTNKINTPNSQASSNKKKSKANLSTEKSNNPVIQSPGSNEIKSNKVTQSKSPKTGNCSPSDIFLKKIKRHSGEINDDSSLNESWSVCSDDKLTSNKQSPKLKAFNESITFAKNNIQNVKSPGKNVSSNISIKSPNAINTSLNSSWSVSVDNEGSASNKNKNVGKNEKLISSSPATTPDKNIKSPKSPKSPTPEQRVLRRRTIIIPKKKPDTPNEGTPKRKAAKSNLEKKELLKRRKTIAGEEISMLRPEEISNKALEKVVS
jgi:ribosomal RNA-processing protein 1